MLLTRRLALRQFTAADAGHLLELDGDPAVMRYLEPRTKSLAEVEHEVLPRFLAYHARHRDFGFWAAEAGAGGRFVGWFGLRPVVPGPDAIVAWPDATPGEARVASLGYRLRRAVWGRGYATEGARALVRLAFTRLGVDEVVATTMAVNVGSRRVLEKAGLRHTRTVYLDWPDPLEGNEHGDVEYRLQQNDWAG